VSNCNIKERRIMDSNNFDNLNNNNNNDESSNDFNTNSPNNFDINNNDFDSNGFNSNNFDTNNFNANNFNTNNFNNGPYKIKNSSYYIIKALKFYEMKNDKLAKVVFLAILGGSLISMFIPGTQDTINIWYIALNSVLALFVNLASFLYLMAYLRDIKGESYTGKELVSKLLAKAIPLVIGSILYLAGSVIGAILFVVPGLVFNTMFILYPCYVIDKNKPVISSFSASSRATYGYKWRIFSIIVSFALILFLPTLIIFSFASSTGNDLVFYFVFYFISTITSLMQQRLVALLYMSLEYGR